MLDINFIRANRQKVEDAIHNKVYDIDLDEILRLDDERKELSREIDELRQERNKISAQMKGGKPDPKLIEQGKELKAKLAEKEPKLSEIEQDFITKLKQVPNVYEDDVPIGLTEDDLIRRDRKYKKVIINLNEITASKTNNFDYGFIKLISDRNYRILGASIVAPHASLLAEEISLAIRHNLTAVELASTPHVMNSYNYLVKLAATKLLGKNPATKTKHVKKRKK